MEAPNAVQERHYQSAAVEAAFARWEGGERDTLVILPTGTGKTVVAGKAARRALDEHGRRTLFLAHREELIRQAQDKLARFDLGCAVEMADERAHKSAALFGRPDVVIGTIQTLQDNRLASWPRDEFGLIITDEAHHARASSYKKIYNHFQGYWHLGITATPDRGDGKNLGAVYNSIAYEYSLRQAIEEGFLVPLTTARLMTGVDLNDIKTTGGDFNLADLEARISPFVEELADAIVKEAVARKTVVFCPDVGSSEAMADALSKKGMPAVAVSGKLPKHVRSRNLEEFAKDVHQAVVCCDLLIEGWDCPAVSCVVVCRPTKKRNRYAQMIGRGTRPDPGSGKADCLIIDFAWKTTAGHKLVKPIELFDDTQIPDRVLALAAQLMDDGLFADPKLAVEEADRLISEEDRKRREREREQREREERDDEAIEHLAKRFNVRITGRQAEYRKIVYDPVGVGKLVGLPVKQGWDFDAGSPATEKQRALLERLGIDDPSSFSKFGASKAIDHLLKRLEKGLATPKQVGTLVNLGVETADARAMTFTDASRAIGELLDSKRRIGRRSA
jgi:superfamily II DNA or RNA helicase